MAAIRANVALARPSPEKGALFGPSSPGMLVGGFGLLLIVAWSYWPTLLTMEDRWSHDPQYSHGFLVPVFAAVVLWNRRGKMPRALEPSWWGLLLLALGIAIRLMGASRQQETLDAISLLPTLMGFCLIIGGWKTLSWTWPAIAFLAFMLPLPFSVETALAHPLRRLATNASTYCLQLLGYPAISEGNTIHIDEIKLGVVEACSGLGMLMTFFALSTAVAIVIERRLTDKLMIVASAIPIAVIANVARITATGVAHCTGGEEAGRILHDWAGWLMMPLALGLLWFELFLLARLLVEVDPPAPLSIDYGARSTARPGPFGLAVHLSEVRDHDAP